MKRPSASANLWIGSRISSSSKDTRTYRRGTLLPSDWLRTFDTEQKRQSYTTIHLLGDVPDGLDGFETFYEARRQRLEDVITDLLR